MANYVTYEIEIPKETYEKLNFIAKAYGCSIDGLVKDLIEKDYEKKK